MHWVPLGTMTPASVQAWRSPCTLARGHTWDIAGVAAVGVVRAPEKRSRTIPATFLGQPAGSTLWAIAYLVRTGGVVAKLSSSASAKNALAALGASALCVIAVGVVRASYEGSIANAAQA